MPFRIPQDKIQERICKECFKVQRTEARVIRRATLLQAANKQIKDAANSPKRIISRWVELFNKADAAGLAGLYHDDAVNHQVANEPIEGKANIRTMFEKEFQDANLDRSFKWDYIQAVSSYCSRCVGLTREHFKEAILKVFEGKEGIEMLETIPNGILQEGIAIGVDKGKIEEKVEVARNMKRKGCDLEFISEMTGLSVDEIEHLDS